MVQMGARFTYFLSQIAHDVEKNNEGLVAFVLCKRVCVCVCVKFPMQFFLVLPFSPQNSLTNPSWLTGKDLLKVPSFLDRVGTRVYHSELFTPGP